MNALNSRFYACPSVPGSNPSEDEDVGLGADRALLVYTAVRVCTFQTA